MKKIPQDIVGNIAILKFPRKTFWPIKKYKAYRFLKAHKNISTVVEKTSGFSGQLRIPTTKYLAGEKTFIATHKENNCIFKFNINTTYFSPRLSNERKIISEEVTKIASKIKNPKILIMFAGIAPYPIVIAKSLRKLKKPFHIYSNELNEKANKAAKENIKLNKLEKEITLLPGNASKLKIKQKFDIILMPRPNLKDTFLTSALKLSKPKATFFYHGFGTEKSVLEEIKSDTKGKIGKIKIRKAGDIGPYLFRWQAIFEKK